MSRFPITCYTAVAVINILDINKMGKYGALDVYNRCAITNDLIKISIESLAC